MAKNPVVKKLSETQLKALRGGRKCGSTRKHSHKSSKHSHRSHHSHRASHRSHGSHRSGRSFGGNGCGCR